MTREHARDRGRRRAYEDGSSLGRLWVAILTPPLTWAAQFNAAYFLVSVECEAGVAGFSVWLFLVSLVALVVTGAAAAFALQAWRASREPISEGRVGDVTGRSGAMALLALALSGIFGFAIVLTGATQIVVPSC